MLDANGVESHIVDSASIALPRRHRRAKTDAIYDETLLRTLERQPGPPFQALSISTVAGDVDDAAEHQVGEPRFDRPECRH
jgi:hypothetical protein